MKRSFRPKRKCLSTIGIPICHPPRFLHRAIPGQLPLRLRPGLLLGAPPKHGTVSIVLDAGDLGRDTADPRVHLDKQTVPWLSGLSVIPFFALADFVDGPRQIAIPFQ